MEEEGVFCSYQFSCQGQEVVFQEGLVALGALEGAVSVAEALEADGKN